MNSKMQIYLWNSDFNASAFSICSAIGMNWSSLLANYMSEQEVHKNESSPFWERVDKVVTACKRQSSLHSATASALSLSRTGSANSD